MYPIICLLYMKNIKHFSFDLLQVNNAGVGGTKLKHDVLKASSVSGSEVINYYLLMAPLFVH